jgi:hypothetical protein
VTGVKLNKRLLAVGLTFFVAIIMLSGTIQAQTITPGVEPASVFDYHVSSYWTSSDAYASIPDDLTQVNQTSHVEVRIATVNATTIETSTPYYFYDEQPILERGYINLHTGEGAGFQAIIAANLTVGDRIHPDGDDTLTVLDTTTRNYESGSRETNHVRIVDNNETYTASRDLYFDKATGILVEQVDRTETNDPASVAQITWKLDSTLYVENWTVPEFPVITMVPFFLLAAAFVAVAYKKNKIFKTF